MKRILAFVSLLATMVSLATTTSVVGQAADNTCYVTYALTSGPATSLIGTINLSTAAVSSVGITEGGNPVSEPFPGLAVNSAGQMYATTTQLDTRLYRIEPTGEVVLVGAILDGADPIHFVGGIAFDDSDVLYASGENDLQEPTLYAIDASTGAVISSVPTSIAYGGLAFHPITGELFASAGGFYNPDEIAILNPGTGAATTLGVTGLGGATPDIAFNGSGTLFGVKFGAQADNKLIQINTSTGVGSEIGVIMEGGSALRRVTGFTCHNVGGGANVAVVIDIKPASCPNDLNTNANGNVFVAVLGAADFDVTTIDVASLSFEGLTPDAWWYDDVSAPPSGGESCDCNSNGPDSYPDLVLRFKNQDVLGTIEEEYEDGDSFTLTLEGELDDSTPLSGDDCVDIKVPGKGSKHNAALAGLQIAPVPTSFALEQNYPNPFNPTTAIGFSLPSEAFVELSVYNAVGQRVATLVSQSMPAGRHTVQWDATSDSGLSLSSGLYIYRISAGEFVQTQKMLLLE